MSLVRKSRPNSETEIHPHGVFPATMFRTLVAYMWLMRVHASITAGLAVLVVASILHENLFSTPVLMAALVVFLITSAGNILNDYYDYEIDKINKQTRPIPSRAISLHAALAFSWILFVGGFAASLALNSLCLAMAVVNAGLLVAYARYSKQWGLWKNLVVSYLVGSIFLFTSLAVQSSNLLVLILGICAFLVTFAREIMKDIEDIGGDCAWNAKTLPLTLGTQKAYLLSLLLLVLSIVFALVPYTKNMMHETSLLLIFLGAVIFAYGCRSYDAAKAQKYIMAGSMIELLAFFIAQSNSLVLPHMWIRMF